MAVVPSLAAMAALTLFHNPREGYSVDFSGYLAPATVIQRFMRRRRSAATRINAAMRGYLSRANTFLGRMVRVGRRDDGSDCYRRVFPVLANGIRSMMEHTDEHGHTKLWIRKDKMRHKSLYYRC